MKIKEVRMIKYVEENKNVIMAILMVIIITIFCAFLGEREKVKQAQTYASSLESSFSVVERKKDKEIETLQSSLSLYVGDKEDAKEKYSKTSVSQWKPTYNVTVNEYLENPGGKIRLRGTVIQKCSGAVTKGEVWLEINSEIMGLDAQSTVAGQYKEYTITGDRLYVRMKDSDSSKIGDLVIIEGTVIKKVNNSHLGILAIEGNSLSVVTVPSSEAPSSSSASPQSAPAESAPSVTEAQTSSASSPAPTAPPAPATLQEPALRPFANCTEARRAGRVNIPSTDPQYGSWLDRDHDGIGCDQ